MSRKSKKTWVTSEPRQPWTRRKLEADFHLMPLSRLEHHVLAKRDGWEVGRRVLRRRRERGDDVGHRRLTPASVVTAPCDPLDPGGDDWRLHGC